MKVIFITFASIFIYRMENYSMIAKTFFGFEDILEKELRQLGAMKVVFLFQEIKALCIKLTYAYEQP